MKGLLTVFRYTFLEGVRARFFLATLFLSLFLAVLGSFLASIPYGKVDQVMARIGWGAVTLFALLFVTFYTVQHMTRERDQRVLHLLLAKPVSPASYALGKFFGLWALLTGGVLVAGFFLYLSLLVFGQEPHPLTDWWLPALAIVGKAGVLLAYALLFATLFPAFIALMLTFVIYLMGVGSADLMELARRSDNPLLLGIAYLFLYLAPQFAVADVEGWVIFQIDLEPRFYGYLIGYFLGYLLIVLGIYVWAFQARELKE